MCDKNKLRNFQKTKLSKIKVKLAWLKSKWLTRCMQPIFKQLFLIKIESEAMVSTSDFYPVLTKSTISWEKSILWALLNDWRKTTTTKQKEIVVEDMYIFELWLRTYIWIVLEDICLTIQIYIQYVLIKIQNISPQLQFKYMMNHNSNNNNGEQHQTTTISNNNG